MMKRWAKRLLLFLVVVSALPFGIGCGLKEAVQNKTREILAGGSASVSSSAGNAGTDAQTGSAASKRPIATLPPKPSYEERLENEWLNAPEVGYLWTITIHDMAVIDVMGLCTATYNVNMSASHIGPDLFGAYFGGFDFDYGADMAGLSALLTMQGGSVDYDTDGWFKNEKFVFELEPYERDWEEMLENVISANSDADDVSPEEQAIMDAYLGMFFDLENTEKPFETQSEASAMWWAFDMPMTEGDMSGFFEMNGVMGGIVEGRSEVDSTGKNVAADVRVAFGLYANGALVYKFDERYSETDTFDNPLPYTIKVYPDDNVVMTFYNSSGGPITAKCYGTIDKIPIEEVQSMPQR